MKTKTLPKTFLLGLLAFVLAGLTGLGQNAAVKQLWQDPRNEFHAVAGCPTNWPVYIDYIGAATSGPDGTTVMTVVALLALKAVHQAAFDAWYSNTYLPFVAARVSAIETTNTSNRATFKALSDDIKALRLQLVSFEEQWTNIITQAQLSDIVRTNQMMHLKVTAALGRLAKFLEDSYDGR